MSTHLKNETKSPEKNCLPLDNSCSGRRLNALNGAAVAVMQAMDIYMESLESLTYAKALLLEVLPLADDDTIKNIIQHILIAPLPDVEAAEDVCTLVEYIGCLRYVNHCVTGAK